MSLWRVTIEYTGIRVYDLEVDNEDEAIDLAKDCFDDENIYEKITKICVKEFPIFSENQIDEALKDAEKFCDTSKQ